MIFRRPFARLALIVAAVLIAAVAVPATISYIAVRTDPIVNTFEPDYTQTADAVVDVHIVKTVTNLAEPPVGPENFQFLLTRTDTEKAIKLTSGADGRAFGMLTFSKEEAGKTYTYRLTEVNDAREHILYDETEHIVTVTLKLNDDATLTPTVTLDGLKVDKVEVTFTNIHTTEILPPDTGDDAQPLLYICMMLLGVAGLAALIITARKRTA